MPKGHFQNCYLIKVADGGGFECIIAVSLLPSLYFMKFSLKQKVTPVGDIAAICFTSVSVICLKNCRFQQDFTFFFNTPMFISPPSKGDQHKCDRFIKLLLSPPRGPVGWTFGFRIRFSFSGFRFFSNSGSLKTFICASAGAAGFIWGPFQTAACLRGPTLPFSRWLFSLNLIWLMMVLFIKDCPEIWARDDCPRAG